MLLAAANLAQQERCIHDHARDNQGEKDNAEKQQHAFAPVEDDPSNVERNGECNQTDAQAEKQDDGSASAGDAHGVTLILQRLKRISDSSTEGLQSLLGYPSEDVPLCPLCLV